MARLPVVGGDIDNWGTILNEFLRVNAGADGALNAYALADLPAAGTAGRLARVTNVGGGQVIYLDNGSAWVQVAGDPMILAGVGPHALGGAQHVAHQLNLKGQFNPTATDASDFANGVNTAFFIDSVIRAPESGGATNSSIIGLVLDPLFETAATGTHSGIHTLFLDNPSITERGATYDYVATLYVENVNALGGVVRNLALWVARGASEFNGQIRYRPVNQGDGASALTASVPLENTQTWNAAGVTFFGETLDITNTASAAASRIARWRVGGVSVLEMNASGNMAFGGAPDTLTQFRILGEFTPVGAAPSFKLGVEGLINAVAGQNAYGVYIKPDFVEASSDTHNFFAGLLLDAPNITNNAAALNVGSTLHILGAPTVGTNRYAIFSDAGLNRFDGDGTRVFELPADATDPTGGGGAATGRIPVLIGGVTRYLAYY